MLICDTCLRQVGMLHSRPWFGEAHICRDCFIEWYDGDGCVVPVEIGRRVRERCGLEPIAKPADASTSGAH